MKKQLTEDKDVAVQLGTGIENANVSILKYKKKNSTPPSSTRHYSLLFCPNCGHIDRFAPCPRCGYGKIN